MTDMTVLVRSRIIKCIFSTQGSHRRQPSWITWLTQTHLFSEQLHTQSSSTKNIPKITQQPVNQDSFTSYVMSIQHFIQTPVQQFFMIQPKVKRIYINTILGVRRSDIQYRYRSDTGILCRIGYRSDETDPNPILCVYYYVIIKPHKSHKHYKTP